MKKRKVRSGDQLAYLKRARVVPLNLNKGMQTKQELRCLTHGEIFTAIPHNYLQTKVCWSGCPKCLRTHIDTGGGLKGASAWVHSEIFAYALRTRPRYSQHTLVSLDVKTKQAVFKCSASGKKFATARPLSEFDTAMGKTSCPHCAQQISESRIAKIAQHNRNRHKPTPGYHYIAEGKACVKHGLLSSGIAVNGRCGLCYPPKAPTGGERRSSPTEIKAARARAKALGIPSRETPQGVELLVCKEHKTVVAAPMSRRREWKLHCQSCKISASLKEAKEILATYYPAVRDYKIVLIPGKYRYVEVLAKGVTRVLNLSAKSFQVVDRERQAQKHYIAKEYAHYGT